MIEKLRSTYAILKSLEELNSKSFISEEIKSNNELLNIDLHKYKDLSISSIPSNEEKDLISNIITKIDLLESKIFPKANLVNSFSDSIR
jgi:hypothetical protein|tara:strand:+ start:1524 stop:1790 length:267 start_codon:yes stop_codon:yes gene_type:complete